MYKTKLVVLPNLIILLLIMYKNKVEVLLIWECIRPNRKCSHLGMYIKPNKIHHSVSSSEIVWQCLFETCHRMKGLSDHAMFHCVVIVVVFHFSDIGLKLWQARLSSWLHCWKGRRPALYLVCWMEWFGSLSKSVRMRIGSAIRHLPLSRGRPWFDP